MHLLHCTLCHVNDINRVICEQKQHDLITIKYFIYNFLLRYTIFYAYQIIFNILSFTRLKSFEIKFKGTRQFSRMLDMIYRIFFQMIILGDVLYNMYVRKYENELRSNMCVCVYKCIFQKKFVNFFIYIG